MLGLDWGCGREKHRVSRGRWSPGSKWIRSCLEKWAFTLRVSYLLINPHSDSFYYQFQNYESEFAQFFWLIRASLLCLVFVIAFYIRNNLIGQTFGIPTFGTGETKHLKRNTIWNQMWMLLSWKKICQMIYYWPIQMSLNIQWSIYLINLETQMWIHMSEMWWQVTFTKNL